jgi:hypothetical protein
MMLREMLQWPRPLPLEDERARLLREVHKTVLGPTTQEKPRKFGSTSSMPNCIVDDFNMI